MQKCIYKILSVVRRLCYHNLYRKLDDGGRTRMRVAVVTDSTADLTVEEAERLGVAMVPLQIGFGDETLLDRVEITPAAFYRRLREGGVLPTTSQPSPTAFADVFSDLLTRHDAIVGAFISRKLSGTIGAAEMARKMVMESGAAKDGVIELIDSRTASYGLGQVIVAAARVAARGGGAAEVGETVRRIMARSRAYIAVDSLESLRRGGRIGGAAALLGSLLQIKPILTVKDGLVSVEEKVRTFQRALDVLAQRAAREATPGDDGGAPQVSVVHTAAPEHAAALAERLTRVAPHVEWQVRDMGPTLGVHLGAGQAGVVYIGQPTEA